MELTLNVQLAPLLLSHTLPTLRILNSAAVVVLVQLDLAHTR